MGSALSSVPLCSRAGDITDDNNNEENVVDNNLTVTNTVSNVIVACQPAPTPVDTETAPPVDTSTPKLDRDLGERNQDSLEFVSDKTFGSDSGLDHSSDEQELSRYDIVDDDYLDTAIDTEDDEEVEDETQESLESGDLGVDRATTFRVEKKDDIEDDVDKEDVHDHVLRKLEDLEDVPAVSSRLSELDIRDSYSHRS